MHLEAFKRKEDLSRKGAKAQSAAAFLKELSLRLCARDLLPKF
jgi:hypothetical protein